MDDHSGEYQAPQIPVDRNERAEQIREEKEAIRERYKGVDRNLLEMVPAKPRESIFDSADVKSVCAYCRVSTDDPKQTSSYELQKNHYEEFIREHKGWSLYRVYADEEVSYPEHCSQGFSNRRAANRSMYRWLCLQCCMISILASG